ncbi:hypothetical protein ACFL02_06825 [Planctomycetota bacterium]
MTSKKQTEANRGNALKSTGPVTPAGKARVAQNAVKHGLLARHSVIQGESQEEFDAFRQRLFTHLVPEGELELILVDRIAAIVWRLHRAGRFEEEMFSQLEENKERQREINESQDKKDFTYYLITRPRELVISLNFEHLNRYETQIERSLFRTLHELQRLQAARQGRQVSAPLVVDVDVSGSPEQ